MPTLASAAVSPCFQDLIQSVPEIHKDGQTPMARDFDWALHPGGSLIITGVEQAMKLTPEHLRASYEIYMKYGNSSSATILSVLDKLRESEGKEQVIACAFGPGIALEMMVLKRRKLEPTTSNGLEHADLNDSSNGNEASNGSNHMESNGNITEGAAVVNGHSDANGITPQTNSTEMNGSGLNGAPNVNSRPAANGEQESESSLPVEDLD